MSKQVTVKQNPEQPVPTEVLADAIVAIAAGVKKLRSGRLQDRTLHMLIADAAPSDHRGRPISLREVKAVLAGIEALERTHLKKKP